MKVYNDMFVMRIYGDAINKLSCHGLVFYDNMGQIKKSITLSEPICTFLPFAVDHQYLYFCEGEANFTILVFNHQGIMRSRIQGAEILVFSLFQYQNIFGMADGG